MFNPTYTWDARRKIASHRIPTRRFAPLAHHTSRGEAMVIHSCRLAAVTAILLATISSTLSAAVTSYTVRTLGPNTELTSITAERDGRVAVFDASKLIGIDVVSFRSLGSSKVVVSSGSSLPRTGTRSGVLEYDLAINSGFTNLGGSVAPLATTPVLSGPQATPGMAVRFRQPVLNLPGDDVVFFEVQRGEGSPLTGDAIHVSPLRFEPGLKSTTIEGYDIDFNHPRAQATGQFVCYGFAKSPQSLHDLEHESCQPSETGADFKALAVAVDLSALGYPEGASVEGLFFQNRGTTGSIVDPVLIAGLPVPDRLNLLPAEPTTESPQLLHHALNGPMAGVEDVIFAVRAPGRDHWYANFGYYCCGRGEYPPQRLPEEAKPDPIFRPGGRLCRLNLRDRQVTTLLDDPQGGVRDPQVHYDGQKILFAYRKGGDSYHHLYEIQADGTGLHQLTDGPYDDIEPTYLPDGGIMFVSSRCQRIVNCWRTPVAILYRCDGDGRNIRMVSTNIEHDNTPWPLPDGRLLYMRWEYVDRSQGAFHHLWTTNPDGTGQMVFYGNQRPGYAMLDAKPIPGSRSIVASFSPGHGRPEHAGEVAIVDPRLGPDNPRAVQRISPPRKFYRDPYAFSEDCFLLADPTGILVMDGAGETELVYGLPKSDRPLECHEPRPLRARPRERIIPARIENTEATGRLVLADIYHGRNMKGVERGEIKKLLVLEQLPKPVNFSGGMWPISVGGSFTLARVLGTVPVEPDGSAYMELPAMRSLFFVALDKDDLSVKRMQSFLTVEPGETTSCVGCHEQRMRTPLSTHTTLAAMGRSPSRIKPVAGAPDVFDFPRDIQPLLDRYCVECHSPKRYEGHVDLTGDHTPLFSQSYWTVVQKGLISDGRNESRNNRPPRTIGSSASRLLTMLDGSHYNVKVSAQDKTLLRLWIESSAPYAGTYAALGSGMAPVEFPIEAIERRCGSCHAEEPTAKTRIGPSMLFRFGGQGPALPLIHDFMDLMYMRVKFGYFKFGRTCTPQSFCNITQPEKSVLLRAPLSQEAGGLGICTPNVFADTADADYQAILTAIRQAAAKHKEEKRFDMPGFRPNDYYIRNMQRYGILPEDLKPEDPIDVYATDRAYWKSFH